MDKLERMPFKAQKQLFEKLEKIAGVANLTREERQEYDEALKVYRDCKNIVDYAEEKGEIRGEIKGEIKGIKRTAKKMKESGSSLEYIMECTGLSEEDIRNL